MKMTRLIALSIIICYFVFCGPEVSCETAALAPPSMLQESSPTPDTDEFRRSALSDMKFLTAVFSIASHFLVDGKREPTLAMRMRDLFRSSPGVLEGIDLAAAHRRDNVVIIPFERDGTDYEAFVCTKERFGSLGTKSEVWGISKTFGIQIQERERGRRQSIGRVFENLPRRERECIERIFGALGLPDWQEQAVSFFKNGSDDRTIRRALLSVVNYSRWSTEFFRVGKAELETYLDELIPQKVGQNDFSIRAKSIGISSGEEPYGVAISIFNRLRDYYDAHSGRIGESFDEWLSRWDVTIEAYDRELINLLLVRSGRHDLYYDNPMTSTEDVGKYKSIPELNDTRIWEDTGERHGFTFLFRNNLSSLTLALGGFPISIPYRLRSPMRDWIRPVYVDIRKPGDMRVIEATEADIIYCCYLQGGRRRDIRSFIRNSLVSCLTSKNKSFIAIGNDLETVNPEEHSDLLIERAIVDEISEEMERIHAINMRLLPAVPEGKILWHVIPKELIPISIRGQFESMVSSLNRTYPDMREKIKIVDRGSLHATVGTLTSEGAVNIVDVACVNKKDLEDLPEGVKALVFNGGLGGAYGFRQVEGIIAALRALHQDNAGSLIELYEILTGKPFTGSIKELSENLNNPRHLADLIIFNLKPVTINRYEDLQKLNENLLKLIQAA